MATVLEVLKGKRKTIRELRDSDNSLPHALDKADITNRSHHLFSAQLRILLNTQYSRQY